jgi:hypothetical protein
MLLQIIHITKRALVVARQFGNPLLGHGWARAQQRKGEKHGGQMEEWFLHLVVAQVFQP